MRMHTDDQRLKRNKTARCEILDDKKKKKAIISKNSEKHAASPEANEDCDNAQFNSSSVEKSSKPRGGNIDANLRNQPTTPKSSTAAFPYPPCWTDDKRMDVLMGAFRLRSLNPGAYDAQVKFWQDMIKTYCEHYRCPVFTKRQIQMAFQRKSMVPFGLDVVLQAMKQTRTIRERSEYEYDPGDSWQTWLTLTFLKNPLYWAISKIPLAKRQITAAHNIQYVHVESIKKLSIALHENVLNRLEGEVNNYKVVLEFVQSAELMDEDTVYLCLLTLDHLQRIGLHYINRDGRQQIELIKIPDENARNIHITDMDRAVYDLRTTQSNLIKQLHDLDFEIELARKRETQYAQQGKRHLLRSFVRKRLMLEKSHAKRADALFNIELIINGINEAQANALILDAYKMGSQAMKGSLKTLGLTYDNVDETLAEARELVTDQQELQKMLADVDLNDDGDSDADLENELKLVLSSLPKEEKSDESERDTQTASEVATTTTTTAITTSVATESQPILPLNDINDMLKNLKMIETDLLDNSESITPTA